MKNLSITYSFTIGIFNYFNEYKIVGQKCFVKVLVDGDAKSFFDFPSKQLENRLKKLESQITNDWNTTFQKTIIYSLSYIIN